MGYGAQAKRVPARGTGYVEDADIFNIGLVGRCKRGFATVQTGIYNMDDFRRKCGGFHSSRYAAHVLDSFYQTLQKGIAVETKVRMWQASDAVQATANLMDSAGTPVAIFAISAGKKSEADKSAFGNDIGYKVSRTENVTFKLTATASSGAALVPLDQVDNLEAGYYIKIADGSNTEYGLISSINTTTRVVTLSGNLTNSYLAAATTVSRLDWTLQIGVKDDLGVVSLKEEWKDRPFTANNTQGMAKDVNDADTGSDYVVLAVNGANATAAENKRPAAVTTWTFLASGSDGTAPVDADWATLVTDLADESIQILLAPESTSATHNINMTAHATNYQNCIYYGQAANGATAATLQTLGAQMRGPYNFAMIPCDKWLERNDPTKPDGGKIQIPPVGYAAAHWFNTYVTYGEARVAAGNEDPVNTVDRLLDSNGLVHDDLGGEGDRMIRKYSVNIARFRRNKGVTINSARTVATDAGYQYQSQIMQFLLYRKTMLEFLRTREQVKSGTRSQESIRDAIWSYMRRKYDDGQFYEGQKSDGTPTKFEDVVTIINDFSVNTLAQIQNGQLVNFVQFVGPPPIEEPVLNLASAPVTTVNSGGKR